MPAIGLDVDDEDGGPLWDVRRGTPLVPGQLAWARLAVGHHCEVWLCWSVDLWVPTLVKVVRPAWTRPRWTRALGREAAALRPLRHPAFPRLLADGGRSELPHLVLEYLDGPALDQALAEEGPHPPGHLSRQRPARRPPRAAGRPGLLPPAGPGAASRRAGRHRRLRRTGAPCRARGPRDGGDGRVRRGRDAAGAPRPGDRHAPAPAPGRDDPSGPRRPALGGRVPGPADRK